jgi:hypothetical protein
VAGAHQLEKVAAALRAGGAEPGKMRAADLPSSPCNAPFGLGVPSQSGTANIVPTTRNSREFNCSFEAPCSCDVG